MRSPDQVSIPWLTIPRRRLGTGAATFSGRGSKSRSNSVLENEMSGVRDKAAIVRKQLEQRNLLWPGAEHFIWDRKANKGFATIPKTMPIVLQIMDDLSGGKPLSSTYLGLWCGTWDNAMLSISKPEDMAYSAGFSGQRAAYTWGARMKILHDLRFIDIKAGKSGPISNVILWNPHLVIRWHYVRKTPGLQEALFNALLERGLEIGASDVTSDNPIFTSPVFPPPPEAVTLAMLLSRPASAMSPATPFAQPVPAAASAPAPAQTPVADPAAAPVGSTGQS